MHIEDSLLGNRSGHKLECFPEASVCSASVGYNSQEGLLLCIMFALYCVTIQNQNLCGCPAHNSSSRLGLNCKRKHLHYKQHLLLLQCSLEVLHRCPNTLAGCDRVDVHFHIGFALSSLCFRVKRSIPHICLFFYTGKIFGE